MLRRRRRCKSASTEGSIDPYASTQNRTVYWSVNVNRAHLACSRDALMRRTEVLDTRTAADQGQSLGRRPRPPTGRWRRGR